MTNRIAMSRETEGLKVTVAVQLRHEGSELSAPVQQFLHKPYGDADEALESVLKTLQQALPHALSQVDAELRVALQEYRLFQMTAQPRIHSSEDGNQATSEKPEASDDKE